MAQVAERREAYILGHSPEELRRLDRQGAIVRPYTERLLRETGIAPGMRVLDVGSGIGDVAFLAAELVGPSGAVVGIDRSPEAVATARTRAAARNMAQVSFLEEDIATFLDGDLFDAIVGRFVLAYQPDPTAVARHLASQLRPGGIVAFDEFWLPLPAPAWPEHPLFQQAFSWITESLRRSGAHVDMGLRLEATFVDAGLPAPHLRIEDAATSRDKHDRMAWLVDTIRTLLPAIERTGVATAAEIDIDTLLDRLVEEMQTIGGMACGIFIGSAWLRTPAI
jgi:SAM-dependent methyltransferase